MNPVAANAPPRSAPWKRRPTIRAILVLTAALAVDFALFRNAKTHVNLQSAAVWLYIILLLFIWRYVPAPWDRRAVLLLFLGPMAILFLLHAWFGQGL